MRALFFIFTSIFLIFSLSACGQATTKSLNTSSTTTSDSLTFPDSWTGIWEGELQISNAKGIAQRIPMALEILPTKDDSTYTWAIIYGEDREKGKRDYLLEVVDREKGLSVVDEQNTIALEAYLFGNKFYSGYLVAGNYILIVYSKIGDELHFEVVAGKETPVSITGNEKHNGEDIPEVKTFPVTAVQHAILKKN